METHNPIGIVVIGYGYWSPKLIRNIEASPRFSLKAICEKDESRHDSIRNEYPSLKIYRHYRDAFADPEVHAVVIATIPSSHFRIAKLALESGKHVLVEKPLTLSVEDGKLLIAIASAASLVLMVDHTYLYSPAIQKMRELVAQGAVGKVYSVESTRVNLGLFQRDTNVIWDLAPHDFSVLLALFPGKPTHVSAVGSKTVVHPRQERSQESVAHILLHYPDFVAHVHVSWISPIKVRQLTVIGSDQTLVYDQMADDHLVMIDQGVYPNQSDGESGPLFIYKTGERTPIALEADGEDLGRMIADFGESIEHGILPVSNAPLALSVVRLLNAANRSLRRGGRKVRVSYTSYNPFALILSRYRPR